MSDKTLSWWFQLQKINRRGGSASSINASVADPHGNCHVADLHQLMLAKSMAFHFYFSKVWVSFRCSFLCRVLPSLWVKSNPPQKSEAVPKLIYTKSPSILLEEQFCTTLKSLNFPSAAGSSTELGLLPSAVPGIICIHNHVPHWMQDQDLGLVERGWGKSRSGLEFCFFRLHTSGWVQIPNVCRANDDFCLNHYLRFHQQNDALVLFSQVCSSACEIGFWFDIHVLLTANTVRSERERAIFCYWSSEWTAVHLAEYLYVLYNSNAAYSASRISLFYVQVGIYSPLHSTAIQRLRCLKIYRGHIWLALACLNDLDGEVVMLKSNLSSDSCLSGPTSLQLYLQDV